MLLKAAYDYIGGLSNPSKMPGYGYGLPAKECKLGALLMQNKRSTCHSCYALKGRYTFPAVQKAQYRRLASLKDLARWTEAFIVVLSDGRYTKEPYFRWHDSGDIQSLEHLEAIAAIAAATPRVKHWLPTREVGMVLAFNRTQETPSNLVIRVSTPLVDQDPEVLTRLGVKVTSGVVKHKSYGQVCPARQQGNKCMDCRACWDKRVRHIVYEAH